MTIFLILQATRLKAFLDFTEKNYKNDFLPCKTTFNKNAAILKKDVGSIQTWGA